jgi:4-amino-4-deoxy-L-arabinose transferase-like glycosyltransferase
MERYWTDRSAQSLRRDLCLLAVLILAGGFLRVWNLSVPSLWVDEANTVYSAESMEKTGQDLFPSGRINGRAQLHTALVALVFRFLGVSEMTARLPSVFFGLLSVIMVYFLGKRVFNNKVGLWTAFFVTFSHFEIGWSRTARMYTLLQFLSLLTLYIFILGFERRSQWGKLQGPLKEKRFSLIKLRRFFRKHQLSPLWLVLCLFLTWLNAFQVHLLGIFLLGGMFIYVLFITGVRCFFGTGVKCFLNKYSIFALCAIVIAGAGWFFLPGVQSLIRYFLAYTPPWAEGTSSAQGRMYLFDFLISPYRFPFAAFFFVGGIQMISRREKIGWIPVFGFLFPLLCLTFVFTHRVPTYLFYVYPLFLMIAAYGFVNLLESERLVMLKDAFFKKRWIRFGVFVLYFFIFLISPWFRISLHIPFLEDGITNLAVTPNEWKEAGQYVRERFKEGEVTITSLPIVAMYYGIRSDYDLNWTHLSQAKTEAFQNKEGKWADVYAGVACIESVDELDQIVRDHHSGWLVVAKYHMEHELIIPAEVRNYIETHFETPFKTRNETVWVYHWGNPVEEAG